MLKPVTVRLSVVSCSPVPLRQQQKERLWQGVEQCVRDHPAKQVLHSLSILTQDSAITLRERTAAVDVKKDAEKLRWNYCSTRPEFLTLYIMLLE